MLVGCINERRLIDIELSLHDAWIFCYRIFTKLFENKTLGIVNKLKVRFTYVLFCLLQVSRCVIIIVITGFIFILRLRNTRSIVYFNSSMRHSFIRSPYSQITFHYILTVKTPGRLFIFNAFKSLCAILIWWIEFFPICIITPMNFKRCDYFVHISIRFSQIDFPKNIIRICSPSVAEKICNQESHFMFLRVDIYNIFFS